MNNCSGCVHERDRRKMISGQGIVWMSTEPHPCTTCRRKDTFEEDNFRPVKSKEE